MQRGHDAGRTRACRCHFGSAAQVDSSNRYTELLQSLKLVSRSAVASKRFYAGSPLDLSSASQVTPACSCASYVVSALQGLRDVIVETQTVLLDAAIKADVPRFITAAFTASAAVLQVGGDARGPKRRDDLIAR